MFFVFGPAGQVLRGGPEKLGQVGLVPRVQRIQALRPRVQEAPGAAAPQLPTLRSTGPAHLREHEAIAAYAQTEQGPRPVRLPLTQVKDVMTTGVITVAPDTQVNVAWHKLAEHQVAEVPVVNALGRVIGMLLWVDMAPADLLPAPEGALSAPPMGLRTVGDVMLSPAPAVAADTDLRRVAAVLLDTGLTGLPVTDEVGTLQGFVSRSDILRAVAAEPPLDLWIGSAESL
ncbi:MAG: CBS domain-containing protein [Burkholderiaceae bacterium]|nr:CBS domain-containing protein [Burkholderiaceae bacterium]